MTQAELASAALRALDLPWDERRRRLDGMENRELAKQLEGLMDTFALMRATALIAKEQGYLEPMIGYLREGSADEARAAA